MPHDPHSFGRRILVATILCVSTLWAGFLLARSGGRFNEALTADGCECHNASPDASGDVTVNITGPQNVTAGSTNAYTLFVTGGPSGRRRPGR